MKDSIVGLAAILVAAFVSSVPAAFVEADRYVSELLYDTEGTFTILGGLAVDDETIYFGQDREIKSLSTDDVSAQVSGSLPVNVTIPFVERLQNQTIAAIGTSYSFPFPCQLGSFEDDIFAAEFSEDGIFDAAVSPAGVLYVLANPDSGGSRLYVYESDALREVGNFGGYSGGIAFDRSGNLYYADQTSSEIWKFDASQVSAENLTENEATVVVNASASYLEFDDHNDLYVVANFGTELNKYDVETGDLLEQVAVDNAFGFGLGKIKWDRDQNNLLVTFTDFGPYASYLYRVTKNFVVNDFDRDGRSDLVVYDNKNARWYALESEADTLNYQQWGWTDTQPVIGDFDGDSLADIAAYHAASGNWYISQSSDGQLRRQNWGWSAATPAPGDYDGDGITDIAVYHQAAGNWYILQSSDSSMRVQNWGWSAAAPVPADYDGDGKTDIAVYHQAAGNWYILQSSSSSLRKQNWGFRGAQPVYGDFDGDGKIDIAVYHQARGSWYILQSSDAQLRLEYFGWSDTGPVPGDYDGDNETDLAVYHRLSGDWYMYGSRDGFLSQNWGSRNLTPIEP